MNILNKFGFALSAILFSGAAFAQNPIITDQAMQAGNTSTEAVNEIWKPSLVKDGIIDKVPHVNKALDMANIREIDAAWKRRIWRQIDVRQKQNQPFIYQGDEYTGGGAFIEILLDAVKKGKVQAYSPMDDGFTAPLDMAAFDKLTGGTEDSVLVEDPATGEQVWTKTHSEFNIQSVTKYRIKEDWIFDRNAGRMVVRIIGIAPLMDRLDDDGAFRGSLAMFWLYYPELRKLLANYEVYNPQNDLHRISWSDYFDGRYFSSYVIKSSANNPTKNEFQKGLRGLEEGQKAMDALIDKESDMWQK